MTNIEWAEEVWNPTLGCSLIAPGCKNCYAMRDAYRKQFHPNEKIRAAYSGLTQLTNGHPVWTGKVNLMEDRLSIPLRKRKPTTWFVDSMSDLFHADVPPEFIDKVFAVMKIAWWHRFIILTKRPQPMSAMVPSIETRIMDTVDAITNKVRLPSKAVPRNLPQWPLPNVIIGASASDQYTFDAAVPAIRSLAASGWHTVWSLEPLLGPINIGKAACASWIIVGGESGPDARPCNVQWIRDIVSQCTVAGVPCFVKQLGAEPVTALSRKVVGGDVVAQSSAPLYLKDRKGGDMAEWPKDLRVRQLLEVLR